MNKKFLASIERPSRYLGGETGTANKDPEKVALRFCLAFPDVYEVGMSHLGHQLLYAILNEQQDVFAERVYTPWVDAMEVLKKTGLLLHSLETQTPLSQFDAIGFTLAYELAGTNMLAMLELGGIPIESAHRNDDHPLILAGGPCAFNPEPTALFVDAFHVGDGEEAIVEIARALIATKGSPRKERLQALGAIQGVYVPALAGLTPRTLRRILPDLNDAPHGAGAISPNARAVHERLTVEVARGCTRGCRFCQAGYLYRPVRERHSDTIAQIIEKGLAATGFSEISLLSLSTGDYSCIQPLLSALIEAKAPERISVSLPSLRVETLNDVIMDQISRVKRTGFTLAPEAGTDRLRAVLNKDFTDDDILRTVRRVFDLGWDLVKLYFMIGLPTETLADVDGIVSLTHRALEVGLQVNKRARINVNVATFVPKPHTPFQWVGQIELAQAHRRIDRLKAKMQRKRIHLKWQEPEMSLVEGAIARGSRQTGHAIATAYRQGARFDAWTEHFDLSTWEAAFSKADLDLHAEAGRILDKEQSAPWDAIDPGVTREFLLEELGRSFSGEQTPDCRNGECGDCGTCGGAIDVRLTDPQTHLSSFSEPMTAPRSPMNFRYRLRYAKTDRARFISHLELSSAFSRAFLRARLPFAYSQGFSPAPKIAFGPPLPLGVESLDEYVDLLLIERISTEQLLDQIRPEFLPQGVRLLESRQVPIKDPSLFVQIKGIHYLISFEELDVSPETIDQKIEAFLQADTFLMTRQRKQKKPKTIDLKALIPSLKRLTDDTLQMEIAFTEKGSASVIASVGHLFGLDENQIARVNILKQSTRFSQTP